MMDTITVGDFERALFKLFPREDAEDWDRVGLSVGDPTEEVRGVACALDATWDNVRETSRQKANVLLTHHPICLDMPRTIGPSSRAMESSGTSIWNAVQLGVSVISLHTNLDRSRVAALRMPQMLGLSATPNIERARVGMSTGLGAVSDLPQSMQLDELTHRCLDVFGRVAQVFGSPSDRLNRIAFYSGSLGSQGCSDVLMSAAQAVICGECGYHRSLDLAARGCDVIALGHDVSELPHVDCLYDAALACGIDKERVFILSEPQRWFSAC